MEKPQTKAREKVVPIRTLGHFIDGVPVAGASDRWGEVFNPATGAVAARVALASAEEDALATALSGEPFGDVCAAMCTHFKEEDAPAEAATFLRTWVESGMVTAVS